ncbi:Tyrosine-protein phosphatase non-receptor-like protein 4 [Sarcoptes scabiei]|uniref:Tyrosine-protein phosphatase non-receptor-like protein 4 n=1 Tax=Sarcoptes scabiei TaxID=52283 RepID=A0A132AE11_SARSC|nr:Tyrosine-protein phosphatase non-receptor-like protein 4 [Sarcoptes scabiei]
MLRTSLALQSTNCVLDREVFRQNNSINIQSAPNPMQKQPYSTSVPDLSFKNCPVNFANNLNQARFLQSLGAKNSSISASNKTGSEPNLMISNEVPNQLECFEQHLLKLSTVRFGLNEDQIPFQSNWPLQTSAMMPKLGKLPEIEAESTIQQSLNNLGDSNRNHNKNTTNQQQHLISPVSSVTSTVTEAPSTMSLSTSIEQDPNRKQETQQDETNQTASNRTFVGRNSNRLIIFGQRCFDDQDFTKEFELLPRMNPTAKFTTASLNENILRNRFRDILPYEENRVKLTPTRENKTGYINASHVYMTFGTMRQHYIAAQGPLPHTALDFWQMIFEQNVNLIVMVTNFTEAGSSKCYHYLPLSSDVSNNTIRFGDFEIICNHTSSSITYISSFLTLIHNGNKRNVTHLRYTDWNDHSIPGDLEQFLQFLAEMDSIYRFNNREGSMLGKKRGSLVRPPILVHCSADYFSELLFKFSR